MQNQQFENCLTHKREGLFTNLKACSRGIKNLERLLQEQRSWKVPFSSLGSQHKQLEPAVETCRNQYGANVSHINSLYHNLPSSTSVDQYSLARLASVGMLQAPTLEDQHKSCKHCASCPRVIFGSAPSNSARLGCNNSSISKYPLAEDHDTNLAKTMCPLPSMLWIHPLQCMFLQEPIQIMAISLAASKEH